MSSEEHVIDVAPPVWKAWREAARTGNEWEMRLALVGDGPPETTQAALARMVETLERPAEHADGSSASVGEWWSAVLNGCVIIRVAEAGDFEATLAAVCAGLARSGITGKIDLWEPAPGFTPPEVAPMLCCTTRVRGERERRGEGRYQWLADSDAYTRVLTAALRWCGAAASLQTAATGWVAVGGNGEERQLVQTMMREVSRGLWCAVASGDLHGFQAVQANTRGSIVLVAGGFDKWERTLGSLRAFLGDVAGDVAYGAVRRGWKARAALDDGSLPADWPSRPDERPRGSLATKTAFEDVLAPDAFGIQLLGPAYADRLGADRARWEIEQVGDAALLEHARPSRWFAAAPTEAAGHEVICAPDAAELLTAARSDLNPLLYAPGALAAFGFADMADC